MEAVISGVLGEFVSRAISFVAEKCREQTTAEEDLQRLRQLLLRISTVIEEAEGWPIENRAMVRQIITMKEQMFRGYYLLDAFRYRERKTDHDEVSHMSFAQSKFSPAKRFRRQVSDTQIEGTVIGRENNKELKQAVLVLESMVADMEEFVIFLMSCPRMYHQPYGAYLYLHKYMFGRQMEREKAVKFLLHAEVGGNLGVLPIVDPGLTGKSTLVEHVCNDERVRDHFSLILLYSGNDFKDEAATNIRDHCVIKHQNIASGEERKLVVIELLGHVGEGVWKRLLHSAERCMSHGSKIIITSQSEKMVSVGTTEPLMLNCLSKEAYWYFFKIPVFGSTDPEDHPKLTSIAMEMASEMGRSFMFANVVATLLRANLSARFWCSVLRHLRVQRQNNFLLLGEFSLEGGRPRYAWSMANTRRGSKDKSFFRLCGDYQKRPASHCEVPKITAVDLVSGTWSAMPRGKFEILSWRSLIPPYYS
ncbi:hypothetical protein ACQ4PT_059367 [Festuca glaucescens]